ncbi:hypothetical protein ACFFJT_08180 [Dyella flava]|uniref:P-type conjugative transfer protein TrbJ n=1 Tax=Dyella flava TaxID=1920170 RepID=A0ABS2K9X0_9GAMM|nr:hypothetical protein [Dyella flava]MBM7127570.1 hypothetical protein [Dyella flava]GLQ51168.1 hypothetical protein GCM10010872_26170 [Dyella flava]
MSYTFAKKSVLAASLMVGAGFAGSASATFFWFVPANIATEKTAKDIEVNTRKLWGISDNTQQISSSTQNISNYTNDIKEITENNYEVNKNFTWNDESQVINNYYGSDSGVIPVNTAVNTANYGSVGSYMEDPNASSNGQGAISNQQDINNDLVEVVNRQSTQLDAEKKQLSAFAARTYDAKGLGNQMQIANSLAAQQTVQQMETRSLMVAQANAQAAAAQADTDRQARAYAKSQAMRKGLADNSKLTFASNSAGPEG